MDTLSSRFQLPGKVKPYVMAHRGNRALCPENTLASFRQALKDGADILETDLHLTSDGVFVCIHDGTVNRTTNGQGPVAEKSLKDIKALSASYGRAGFESERIPTLSELGSIIPENVALALELKTDRFLEPAVCHQLADELRALSILERTVALSFSTARMQSIRDNTPEIPIGLITMNKAAPQPDFELLGPFWPILLINPFYVRSAHRKGQLVCPLDPTPDSRLRYYLALRADAVITDNPRATIQALKKLQKARN